MAKHTRKRSQSRRSRNRKTRSNVMQLKNIAYSKLSAVTPVIENAAKKTLNAIDYGVKRGMKLIKKRK